MSGPDYQQTRVYLWEDRVVGPRDRTVVKFEAAQAFIDAIWADQGLLYPPKVESLSPHRVKVQAAANRLNVYLRKTCPSWVIVHELAHSMTATHDGRTDVHGPRFMGVYVRMLERYLRMSLPEMLASLREAVIAVDTDARPVFLDPE